MLMVKLNAHKLFVLECKFLIMFFDFSVIPGKAEFPIWYCTYLKQAAIVTKRDKRVATRQTR
jgi:hypothetical protein